MKLVKSTLILLRLITIVFILLLNISCSDNTPLESPSKIDFAKLNSAFFEADQLSNLKSLVVSHNGEIIKEKYSGTGGADAAHDVRSVTKSVIGLLTGIAIDKGIIHSVDETIGQYLIPLAGNISAEKSNIRIRDLLTMSSGFDWEELVSVSGYTNWFSSANQVLYLLDKQLISPPGQSFTYNSAALHLLSVIISRASGMPASEFAKKYLFEPLDIGERLWQTDHQGFNNGGAGLQITPHDMIKIGQLIIDKGEYQGRRIVSAEWIDRLSTPKISTNNSMNFGPDYGYCWWIGSNARGSYLFANGWGGQFIVVVPYLKLVVVATNQWSGLTSSVANEQWYRTLNLILSAILSAVN